jgi:hypothetical protein
MAPTPDQDVAIGFVMALFYGLYLATFFHCLRWHLFTDEGWTLRDRKAIQWSMFTATCILFVLCTINRALELRKSMMQAADSNRVGSKGVDGETIKDKSLPIIQMLLVGFYSACNVKTSSQAVNKCRPQSAQTPI